MQRTAFPGNSPAGHPDETQQFANHRNFRAKAANESKIVLAHVVATMMKEPGMNGDVVLENVRRYRTIASLYRQTAAFRPPQRGSLLQQAGEWEHLAIAELEAYFEACDGTESVRQIN